MNRRTLLPLLLLALATPAGAHGARAGDWARWVDPRIGSDASNAVHPVPHGAGGNTFPGAVAPFGMVQWSPDTPGASPSGYSYRGDHISGFSLTHYSGAGCANGGDLPILPVAAPDDGPVAFAHGDEHASPGSYDVTFANGIRSELTASTRSGRARFTFSGRGQAALVVDATRTQSYRPTAGRIEAIGHDTLSGFTVGGNFCGARNSYTLFFVIQLDQPWQSIVIDHGKATLVFASERGAVVRMKVAISYVDGDGARANLAAEAPGWDFDRARDDARRRWNERLAAIQVAGDSQASLTKLYTALYHSLLSPNVFNDVDGRYRGFDGVVHAIKKGHTQYANYSGWDIYRSQVQLVSLLFPDVASDMMQSLVNDAQQCGGAFPRWSQNNHETGVMVGDAGGLIVANGFAFGARDFDTTAALQVMSDTSFTPGLTCHHVAELPGLAEYMQLGYLSGHAWGPASTTLEYTNRDFAVATFARALGEEALARRLFARAANWRATMHDNGLIELRGADGSWQQPLSEPGGSDHNAYVEGNAEQYTWMIPYDVGGLIAQLGGNEAVVARLDRFFARLNAGIDEPNFYMGNEPNFATPWLYDWAGAPWRTQDVVRRIVDEAFTTAPGGLPGNDDLGATSSWLVWAALGLYPAIPGVGGLVIGSPLFGDATVRLGGGKALRITAAGAPARYVQSATLDGVPLARTWLPWERLARGATLRFLLGGAPSPWASAAGAAPPSATEPVTSWRLAANGRAIGHISARSSIDDLADFDGDGRSYDAAALQAALVGDDATTALLLRDWLSPNAPLDDVVAVGQTIEFATPRIGRTLVFVGAANNGPASGVATVRGIDEAGQPRTQKLSLVFADWTRNGGRGVLPLEDSVVATLPRRLVRNGAGEDVPSFVFAQKVTLPGSWKVTSLTLPARVSAGRMHLFAFDIQP